MLMSCFRQLKEELHGPCKLGWRGLKEGLLLFWCLKRFQQYNLEKLSETVINWKFHWYQDLTCRRRGFFIYSLTTRGSGLAFKAFNIAQHDLWTSHLGVILITLNYGWSHYLSRDLSRLFLAQNSILQNGTTFHYHHSDDTDTYIICVQPNFT